MAPHATELETAPRLRGTVGKLARLLRRTDSLGTDLTPTRVAVLLTADRHGPLRLAEVAEREGLNPTLLSRTVAELVTDQLVVRTSDPEDRRSAWVQVTAAGHELAEQVRAVRTAAVQGAIDQLDAADRALIDHALPALERLAQTLADGSCSRDQPGPDGSRGRDQPGSDGSSNRDQPGPDGSHSRDQPGSDGSSSRDQPGRDGSLSREQPGLESLATADERR